MGALSAFASSDSVSSLSKRISRISDSTSDGVTGEGSETGTDDPNVAAPVQEDDTENSAENSNIENGGLTNAELDLINEE